MTPDETRKLMRRILRIPATIDPQRLIAALESAEWTVAGKRTGIYVRMTYLDESHSNSIIVPLDPDAGDYQEMMDSALTGLIDSMMRGRSAGQVLSSLRTDSPV